MGAGPTPGSAQSVEVWELAVVYERPSLTQPYLALGETRPTVLSGELYGVATSVSATVGVERSIARKVPTTCSTVAFTVRTPVAVAVRAVGLAG